jgi:hypothetical protein
LVVSGGSTALSSTKTKGEMIMKLGMKVGAVAFAAVAAFSIIGTGCTVHETTRTPVVEHREVVRERPAVREEVIVR